MADRIKRSAALFKSSWSVLKTHRSLLLLPVLSSIVTLVVVASFIAPVVTTVMLNADLRNEITTEIAQQNEQANRRENQQANRASPGDAPDSTPTAKPGQAAAGEAPPDPNGASGLSKGWEITGIIYFFIFYATTTFVVIFFNAALVAAANEHFQGNPSGLGVGIRLATRRLPQILGWAILSATIGTVLRMISERSGLIGKIVIGLVGMAWTIASYFAVPALVVEGVGPFKALKLSVGTLKETWGESLVIAVGFSIAGLLINLLSIGCIIGGAIMVAVGLAGNTPSTATNISLEVLGVLIGAAGIVTMVAWAILEGTLRGITQTALYRFAKTGDVPDGFDRDTMEAAFKTRKSFRLG